MNEYNSDKIQEYYKIVFYIYNKYFKKYNIENSEILSFAGYIISKSINSFDAERKVKFTTYLAKCAINEIKQYVRKQKIITVNFEYPYAFINHNFEDIFLKENLSQFIFNLKSRDKIILVMKYDLDLKYLKGIKDEDKVSKDIMEIRINKKNITLDVMANYFKVSKTRIEQIIKRIINNIQKEFNYVERL